MKDRTFYFWMGFLLLALCLLLIASGCSFSPKFPDFTPPERPQTVYHWDEEKTCEPFIAKNQIVVGEKCVQKLSAHLDMKPKKYTFMERLGNMISGLGMWAILLVILGVVIAPTATIGFLIKKASQYKKALKQTVAAIKSSKVVDTNPEVANALRSSQDPETKKVVGIMRADI